MSRRWFVQKLGLGLGAVAVGIMTSARAAGCTGNEDYCDPTNGGGDNCNSDNKCAQKNLCQDNHSCDSNHTCTVKDTCSNGDVCKGTDTCSKHVCSGYNTCNTNTCRSNNYCWGNHTPCTVQDTTEPCDLFYHINPWG